MFEPLENNKPFVKAAFEGFAGDGKTLTSVLLAIGIHTLIQSKKPIAVVDTEKALKSLNHVFKAKGVEVIVNQSRTLKSLKESIKWCEDGNSDVLIIDSITHIWEKFLEDYKEQKKRSQLQFQDWGVIKPQWKRDFSDVFVNANCHIIFTGRAGFEYESEMNEETKKREIYKSGIKMKAESETAFEPDILVLMEKVQNLLGDKLEEKEVYRVATILKDRTTLIDGKTCKNPTFDFFYPAVSELLNGCIKDITGGDIPNSFQEYEEKYDKQTKIRKESLAEIDGNFELMGLGTGAKDKQAKAAILKHVFGTTAIEVVENLPVSNIQKGAELIKNIANQWVDYMVHCTDNELKAEEGKLGEIVKSVVEHHKKLMAQLN